MTDTPSASSGPVSPAAKPSKRKAGVGRWITRIVLALMLLVIVILVGLYFARNPLVIAGVVRGGKVATDQETALKDANLALFQGALTLDGLAIANPSGAGYASQDFLTMKSCSVTMTKPTSVLTDTVLIDAIAINGVDIYINQNGSHNNLNDIIAAIDKKTASTGNSTTSPGKQLKIGRIDLTGVKVHIRGAPFPNLDLDLGNISIADPTNPGGRPMKIADLIGKILLHVSQQVLNNPYIPGALKANLGNVTAIVSKVQADLNKDLAGLQGLTTMKNLQDLQKNLPNAGQQLQNMGKDLQKDLGKNLPDMLNGGKNNQQK